jgi:hypothetical protein
VQLQTLFDAAWLTGRLYYVKSSVVRRLGEATIDRYLDCARTTPTPLSAIAFQQLHGAACRGRSDDTAFPHRYDHYNLYIHPATDDPADAVKIVHWGRECWDAMQPFLDRAVYVNAMEDAGGKSEQPVRDAYGPNFDRAEEAIRPDQFLDRQPEYQTVGVNPVDETHSATASGQS